jgi:predicted phosphodiesterase
MRWRQRPAASGEMRAVMPARRQAWKRSDPMRIALIADIHGNLPALDAVLDNSARSGVDVMVCLGDVAAFGPSPGEVVARLRAIGCPIVLGDADAELFAPGPPAEDETLRHLRDIDAWSAARLGESGRAYLTALPKTLAIPLDGGETLLAYHGSPRSYKDRILATTSDDDLAAWFDGHGATVYAGGHTHLQLLRRYRDALVVNPGSVGLAYDRVPIPGATVRNPAWAEYAILTVAGACVSVDLRRVPFDVAALVRTARERAMPHAQWWGADWDLG